MIQNEKLDGYLEKREDHRNFERNRYYVQNRGKKPLNSKEKRNKSLEKIEIKKVATHVKKWKTFPLLLTF